MIAAAFSLCAAAPLLLCAAPLDALRVAGIEPSVFEYQLTGMTRSTEGAPRLSFNDRAGNTWFRLVGEHLGIYRLESFATHTNRVFNKSINAIQESRVVSAALSVPSGTKITLVQGERLAWPGWTAQIVSLDSGLGWAVREADAFTCADVTVRVVAVTATSVTVNARSPTLAAQASPIPIPALTDPDRTVLTARWAENAKRRQVALAAAAAQPSAEPEDQEPFAAPAIAPAPPRPRQVITVSSQPQSPFGTVYSYPTEYTVIPAVWDMSGHLISQRVVLPTHFETGYSSFDTLPMPQAIIPLSTFDQRPVQPRPRHVKDLKLTP